jgi:S-adenosylmethionine-diacylglycerol 3-amino-3-carboxypropyl transferase
MLSLTSLEEQRAYFREHFNTLLWRWSIENLCRRTVFKWTLGDPSYDNEVGQQQSIGNYILQRLTHTFENHLVRENHFLTFLYCGKYMNEEAMPVYLQKQHYETIKRNLDKVEIVTDLIDRYLARAKEPFIDKVSLSDISGWVPNETFKQILTEITKKLRKNGIICYRNFLAKRMVNPELLPLYERDVDMIERLNHEDLAFAFTFEVLKKREE